MGRGDADLSSAYGNYRRHILHLVDRGLLALTIPEAPTSKNQRYVTTDKGLRAINQTSGT